MTYHARHISTIFHLNQDRLFILTRLLHDQRRKIRGGRAARAPHLASRNGLATPLANPAPPKKSEMSEVFGGSGPPDPPDPRPLIIIYLPTLCLWIWLFQSAAWVTWIPGSWNASSPPRSPQGRFNPFPFVRTWQGVEPRPLAPLHHHLATRSEKKTYFFWPSYFTFYHRIWASLFFKSFKFFICQHFIN